MSWTSWILNPLAGQIDELGLTDAFDPGRKDRKKAKARDDKAARMWEGLLPRDPATGKPILRSNTDAAFDLSAPEIGTPDGLHEYGVGPYYNAEQDDFKATGDSAANGVALDGSSVANQKAGEDYFMNLAKGGKDAVAEADYQRRTQQAEQARRAATEGALARLETSGRGGSGASLLAGLNAAGGQASDQYLAGLDASAQTQMRRDSAASQGANLANQRGAQQLGASQANAAARDAWSQWQQGTNAAVSAQNADRRQHTGDLRFARTNEASDKNVDMRNQRAWWEGPGKNQAMYDRQFNTIAGATGQLHDNATGLRSDGQNEFGWGKTGADAVSGLAKSYGGS